LVFAAVYLSLSQTSTTHFSEPLDHSGALYLTITIISTVGVGLCNQAGRPVATSHEAAVVIGLAS
jgi:hypothetical protein